jgi:hypothetical protein
MKIKVTIFAASALFLAGCGSFITNTPGPVITDVPAVEKNESKATDTPTPTPTPAKPSDMRAETEAAEVFPNDIQREAAAIIDESIWAALDGVYAYEPFIPEDFYLTAESRPFKVEWEVYSSCDPSSEKLARKIEELSADLGAFRIKESEWGKSLVIDTLTANTLLVFTDPRLMCYQLTGFDRNDVVNGYFDPNTGTSAAVTPGTPKMEKLKHDMEVFDAVLKRVTDKMPEDYSDAQKYTYLAMVLATKCNYDKTYAIPTNGTAYGALVNGCAICQGYASAYQLLCEVADLSCGMVEGQADGVGHMWNLVTLNDETYYVDVTWADGYRITEPDFETYIFMSEEEAAEQDHTRTNGPKATGETLR